MEQKRGNVRQHVPKINRETSSVWSPPVTASRGVVPTYPALGEHAAYLHACIERRACLSQSPHERRRLRVLADAALLLSQSLWPVAYKQIAEVI
jgi:hypothetical protein